MTSVFAYLGIGSSLGDRVAHLQNAVDRLAASGHGVDVRRVSPIFESPHLGLEPGDEIRYPRHLNAVIEVETSLAPMDLLARAQSVEVAGERQRSVRWGPRTIDVDLLLVDDRVVETAQLTLPHPGLAQRAFVLLPLVALAPDLRMPDGTPIAELARSESVRGQQIELFGAKLRLPI